MTPWSTTGNRRYTRSRHNTGATSNQSSVVMTLESACAFVSITGPIPEVSACNPAMYNSAPNPVPSVSAVSNCVGTSGIDTIETAVLKFCWQTLSKPCYTEQPKLKCQNFSKST